MTQAEEIEELRSKLDESESKLLSTEKRLSILEENGTGKPVEFADKDAKAILQSVAHQRFDMERVFDFLEAIGQPGSPKRKFNRPQYNEKGERLGDRDQPRAVYSEKTLITDSTGKERYIYA